ncbi:MAG: BMP family ABC transporter substrate-binding protein [Theionarchaea archaeon]|nr:BMP family ABC transporter substrate-binding protein [Theionarchaea archaeon]
MNKNVKVLFALVILLSLTLGCIGQEEPKEGQETESPPVQKFAIVFATGGLGDKSFNDSCYEGAMRIKEEFEVDFDYVEPTAIAEYEGFLRQYAKTETYEIIISIGFDQADALTVVAEEYPNQKFAIVDMEVDKPNVASLIFREHEGAFLVGVAAAKKTETEKLGFVGGMDIPLIRRFLAGYKYGAEYVNPDIEVSWKYVDNWSDPAKGKELALAQFDDGADILFIAAGRSGLGAIQACYEQHALAIGVDSDQSQTVEGVPPETFLCSMMKRVDIAVYETVRSALLGTFQAGRNSYGVAENGVGPFWTLIAQSQELQDEIEELRMKIATGEIQVPSDIDENGEYVW